MGLLSSNHASRARFNQVRQLEDPVRHEANQKQFYKSVSCLRLAANLIMEGYSCKVCSPGHDARLHMNMKSRTRSPKQDLSATLIGSL